MWRLSFGRILTKISSTRRSLIVRGKSTGDVVKDCGWDREVEKANCVNEAERKNADVEMGLIPAPKAGLAIPLIEVDTEGGQSVVDGSPTDLLESSEAVISRRPKLVTQQGTSNAGTWELQFKEKERWENPCMGWCSTADPISNIALHFNCVKDAKDFATKRGWKCQIDDRDRPEPRKAVRKWYGENFAWKKRTRISTK